MGAAGLALAFLLLGGAAADAPATEEPVALSDSAYEVLPGIQPAYKDPGAPQEAARRYFTSTNFTMTCGWHSICLNPRGRLKDGGIESEYGNTSGG